MKLPAPLHQGRLIKRYKRFLADVELDSGETVTAHCANPGSMMGLNTPGLRVWLAHSTDPKRKLAYTWHLVEADGGLVGMHTGAPNKLVEEAIRNGVISELAGYGSLRREVKYGRNSRIDLLLEEGPDPRPCYVEVKNVHLMREPGLAEFPDSVTTRGAKHLEELGDMVDAGARAVMVYLVQRTDCQRLAFAADLDPGYANAVGTARARGVETLCYACAIDPETITATRALPILTPSRF